MYKNIPITVLTGYLGSGKTTLVNRILAQPQGKKIAVIVNDIGEVNIDAKLIQSKGHAALDENSLISLENGCICCSLRTDLIEQIGQIAKTENFDYILIEASGICEPQPIAQTIVTIEEAFKQKKLSSICYLDAVVAVVDAYRLLTEFSGGEDLINADNEEADIPKLIVEQIEFCNLLLLNKTDLLSEEELSRVEAIVKVLQPSVQIVRTSFVDVPIESVLNVKLFDYTKTMLSAGWAQTLTNTHEDINAHSHEHDDHHPEHCDCGHEHHDHEYGEHSHIEDYGISTFIYYRRTPFIDGELESWVYKFPKNVIRCKGLVWLDDEEEYCFVLEQAGQSISVQQSSRWLASMSQQQREKIWENNPSEKKNWDPEYGDRMTKLVFIGVDMDEYEICKSLDKCLHR